MYNLIEMKITEREETTIYTREKIKKYLGDRDYTSALLLSSIYVEIRLRTLLTDWLSPPKEKWEKVSKDILTKLRFWQLANLCADLGLLSGDEKRKLDKLRKKRNSIAHESKLWKQISNEEKRQIEQLCEFAIQFLERTKKTGSQKLRV